MTPEEKIAAAEADVAGASDVHTVCGIGAENQRCIPLCADDLAIAGGLQDFGPAARP